VSLRALARPAGVLTTGFYVALFSAFGAHLPFWPVWLVDWGLSEAEAGALLGLAIVARIGGGILGPWLADVAGRRRTALALMAGVASVLFLAHLLAESRAALLALTLLSAATLAGAMPIGDALAHAAARMHGFAYAQVRALGSAAFLMAALLCGWAVGRWGADAALWWVVASLTATAVVALRHPGGVRPPPGAPNPERPRLAEAFGLLRHPAFLFGALATASLQAAHGPFYAYGSINWRAQGLNEATIGALWAWGVAVEVGLMFAFGGWLIARVGAVGAFALAGAAQVARWIAMVGEPSGAALWFWQATHAFTFAPAHLGMIAFVAAAAPDRLSASAQGLIAAGFGGVAMALGTVAAAAIHPLWPSGVYLIAVMLTVVGLAATVALAMRWDGGSVERSRRP
jgi:PPP family 3-phenylpropionic acid transporter